MEFSMARSERLTAILSAVVAVAILAGGVTAYQSRTAPIEDVVQLESDFRFQLEVGFLHNHRERAARLSQLEVVKSAWRESQQTAQDRAKLADWLLEATIRSMAGSTEPMPSVPTFGDTDLGDTDSLPATPTEPSVEATNKAFDEATDVVPTATDIDTNLDVFIKPAADTSFTPADQAPTRAPARAEPSSPTAILKSASTIASAAATTTQPVATQPVTAVEPIGINLSELAARIAGYNTGLDEVDQTLSRLEADDFETLAKQVRELAQLTHVYQFVRLYYESLDEGERRWVETPRGIGPTLVALQNRIDRAQETLAGDFLGDFDASNPDRIGLLRQQVAELVSSVSR